METTDRVMHQLYQTTRIISKSVNKMLESHGLFSSEWTIIKVIKERGSMSQATLANYLNIEPAAISKSLFKLEKKGIVERRAGSDKREKAVFLTEAALQQYPIWQDVVARNRKQVFNELSAEDQNQLYMLLKAIFRSAKHESPPDEE
ncbi:MAG: transcriptional regulator, MarR family [Firmicutes bacterium]|nr:transcriptional regulator, MarR family [Bacillota bacterium]